MLVLKDISDLAQKIVRNLAPAVTYWPYPKRLVDYVVSPTWVKPITHDCLALQLCNSCNG